MDILKTLAFLSIHLPKDMTSEAITYTNNSLQIPFIQPFLTGTLVVKYDNHKTGCAVSSDKCFICFQLAVNKFQTTTTSLIDLNGGLRSLPMAPQ